MSKCIKCGAVVSDQEMKNRYDELCKQGIIPKMVTLCNDCRIAAWTSPSSLIVKRVK